MRGGLVPEMDHSRLADAIAKVRERIDRAKERGQGIGEQNTKATLIDPILSALGWQLEELEEVRREYKRKPQDNPVDYALFLLGPPELFVEAKGLGKDLSDRRWTSQVLGYATVVGVEWCVLTNGDEYRLYNSHAAVDVEEKLFRSVKVSDQEAQEYVVETLGLLSKERMTEKRLDVLWKAHTVDRHVKLALEELLSGDDESLIRVLRRRLPDLSSADIRESLRRADIRVLFPAVEPEGKVDPPVELEKDNKSADPENFPGGKHPGRYRVTVMDLISTGLLNPPITLERTYKGRRLTAEITEGGKILFEDKEYQSLSTAAGMARKTIIGAPSGRRHPQANGWTFWRFRDDSSGEQKRMDELRKQYLESKGPAT